MSMGTINTFVTRSRAWPKAKSSKLLRTSCLLLTTFLFASLTACGGCPKAQKAWDAAKAVPKKTKAGPHWMLEVQTKEIHKKLSAGKDKKNYAKSKLKLKSPIPNFSLPSIKFELSDFQWVVDGDQGILKVKVSAMMKRMEILSLTLKGKSPLQMDKKAKKLRLQVRADQFNKASLKLGDGAEKSLRKAIKKQIPKELRGLIPKNKLIKFVKKSLKMISDEGYPLIRKNILKPLGTLAKLEWGLPDYPIDRIAIKVTDEAWRIGLWTEIKADGLGGKAMSHGVAKNTVGARLFISSPWIAAAGNWAMSVGKMPARFNRKGEPKANGEAKAAMTWNAGAKVKRPLKIHLFAGAGAGLQKELDMCLYARAGVNPNLKIVGGALKVNAEGKLEKVEGNKFVKKAVNLSGIGKRTLEWHHKASAPSSMQVGGSKMPLTWLNVALNKNFAVVGIDLGGIGKAVSANEASAPEQSPQEQNPQELSSVSVNPVLASAQVPTAAPLANLE